MRGASVAALGRMTKARRSGKRRFFKWEILCLIFTLTPEVQAQRVEVVSPLVQVSPTGAPRGEKLARLEAARGEWEPFQIVVSAGAQALHGVRAEAAGPFRPRLYREGLVEVKVPSSVEGHAGRWPDPLIPDVDDYAGEKRTAFPFDVPAGESRAIWVDIFVPRDATAGLHRGEVRLKGGVEAAIPIELVVWDFTLPATSSLPVSFGITGNAVHDLRSYSLAALRHRISLHGGSMEPAPLVGGRVDFRGYDAEVAPFLDGTANPGGPAEGARWSAVDLRVPYRLEGAAREEYLRQVVAHFRARGWLDRLFDYTWDEPSDAQLPEVRARAEFLRRVAPEIPRLVTKEWTTRLVGAVDIWCPTVNYLDDKPENSSQPPRTSYSRLWWYQACMSHGCDIVGGRYFTGWPSLAIDAPAVSHRILEWLTYAYGVGGELYYNTVEAYPKGDPWQDARLHGGNGDGTLFYPGRPERIGGRREVPVESIRLKLVREGLEDYEYLHAYEQRFGRPAALALAHRLVRRTFDWEHDPAVLYQIRHQIAQALDGDRSKISGRSGGRGAPPQ